MTDHWYVYIVQCRDRTLYTGITNNLEMRIAAHNQGRNGARYTRIRRPVTLLYREKAASRSAAAKREFQIKKMSRAAKLLLISTNQLADLLDLTTDGHVHTRLCHHAVGEMEDYVLAAITKKLSRIIFLEHYECGINYFECTWLSQDDFLYYRQEGERLRKKYQGKMEIGLGVEVGFNPHNIPETLNFLKSYKWDRIGLSYHFLANGHNHINLLSRKQENIKAAAAFGHGKALTAYFNGLLLALDNIPATVLCHIDAVLRHCPGIKFRSKHWQMIAKIINLLKEKNIALEVNTAGIPLRGYPFPDPAILDLAIKNKISLVAGSDSHRPGDVARYFNRLS